MLEGGSIELINSMFSYQIGLLALLIMLPIFVLNFNRDFRKSFSKVVSKGPDLTIEILLGFFYFVLIFFSMLYSFSDKPILLIKGSILYFTGLICSYLGYYQFFINKGKLVTSGIYRISRNPTYFFTYIAFLGICILVEAWSQLVILGIVALLTHKIILNEEKDLEKKFRIEYKKYKKQVRRYIGNFINKK